MCPHINSVNQGIPVYNLIKTQLVEILSVIAFLLFFHEVFIKTKFPANCGKNQIFSTYLMLIYKILQ